MARTGRLHNSPWKGVYGKDRKYTARVDRAADRGQLTPAGTQPNARDEAKVARKRRAKAVAA